jgi:hypothetical protein
MQGEMLDDVAFPQILDGKSTLVKLLLGFYRLERSY